jgi:hypothetical protein
MCAAVTVMVWYRVGETKGNGKCSVVMCAAVTVMVWYRVGEMKGKGKASERGVCGRSQNCKATVIFEFIFPSVCMK